MSLANRRSWQQHQIGYVHLTVEAEPTDIDHNLDRHRGLAKVTEQLFEMFNRHRLPVTWAVGDPAHSAAAGLVAASTTKHGLALLGDRYLDRQDGRPHAIRPRARPPRVSVSHCRNRGRDAGATRRARRRAHRPGGETGHSRRRRDDRRGGRPAHRDRRAGAALRCVGIRRY